MTAGRWPWKSASAKECVTTYLPKRLALKMDGAKASSRYSAVNSIDLGGDAFSSSKSKSEKKNFFFFSGRKRFGG